MTEKEKEIEDVVSSHLARMANLLKDKKPRAAIATGLGAVVILLGNIAVSLAGKKEITQVNDSSLIK